MPNIQVRSITGSVTNTASENAAYARTNGRIDTLESALDNAITTNGEFDDTWGWWAQVQNGHTYKINGQDVPDLGDKRADSIIVHKRALTENYLNLDVSPAIVTQTKVTYNSNAGENFTRMASEYHELIGEGYCNATQDHSTPNFTAMGATCYNKFKGNVGIESQLDFCRCHLPLYGRLQCGGVNGHLRLVGVAAAQDGCGECRCHKRSCKHVFAP